MGLTRLSLSRSTTKAFSPALGIDNTVFTSTASYQTLEVPSWRSVEVVCSTAASRQRCQSPAPGMGRVICTSTASHQTLEVPSWYSVGVVCSTAARPQRCQSPTPGMDTVICTNKFSCQTCEAPSLRWSMADSSMHGLRPREHQEQGARRFEHLERPNSMAN